MNIITGDWMHLNKKQRAILLQKRANLQVLNNKKAA